MYGSTLLPSSPTPLVDLLRDYSKPMPPGARDLLAELLDPGKLDICGGRLVYEATSGLRREVDEMLPFVVSYRAEVRLREGAAMPSPSQQAARAAGKKYRRSDRTVYRKLQAWRQLVARLHGRKR
jgi:hypothetical protein